MANIYGGIGKKLERYLPGGGPLGGGGGGISYSLTSLENNIMLICLCGKEVNQNFLLPREKTDGFMYPRFYRNILTFLSAKMT